MTGQQQESAPVPGWYADPVDTEFVRYWDGAQWTAQIAPREHQTAAIDPSAARAAHKQEQRQRRQDERAQRAQQRSEAEASQLVQYGREVADHMFGARRIRIYDKGFVSLSMFGSPQFERLISIESSADVAKKSGTGRALGAVMTGGLNLYGSNKRGDVYLVIVTDMKTHALRATPPTVGNMAAAKKLAATGQAVLTSLTGPQVATPSSAHAAGQTPADRLRDVAQLRDDGLISPAEFDQAKARLLTEI